MAFQLNQFKLTNMVGELMNPGANTLAVRLISTLSGTVKAGDVLKLAATEAGDAPVMDKAVSGDSGHAVVLFQAKKATFAANEMIEVTFAGGIVSMAANGTINRGSLVSWNSVSGLLQSTTTNYIGYALDVASASGDIIRVFVQPKLS